MLLTNSLEIELTTKCTLGCPACPRNNPNEKKEDWDVGHLDKTIAKKFADSPVERTYLFVGCYGDPIYHPDFIDIVKYYIERDRRVHIHTNGSFKKQKWWDELASLNWTYNQRITFSVDGLEDTNHIYRIRADWESIMRGMKTMCSLPEDRRPQLEWKYLVFPYNKHQVPEARELAMSLGFGKFSPVKSERDIEQYKVDNNEIYRWPDDKA
jgi:MoaA/NifB/PqqE/SkfB family radical SAM enzyme